MDPPPPAPLAVNNANIPPFISLRIAQLAIVNTSLHWTKKKESIVVNSTVLEMTHNVKTAGSMYMKTS